MSTSTQYQAAAAEANAPQQPNTLLWVREKLTTKPGKYIVFAVQFLLSLLMLVYLRGVVQFAYNSLFYRLELHAGEEKSYCWAVMVACIEFCLLMLFTRRQIITRFVIMLAMPFYFPIFLFNYRHLELIIPLGLMIVITYLASGTGEGPKTILGAVFLMCYILGAVVYFVVQSILSPAVTETVIAREVSPGGNYRYSIVQQLDQADGNTYVAIESNNADMEYTHSVWRAKGLSQEIYRERPLDTFKYEWTTQERREITRALLNINSATTFTLNADQMRTLNLNVGYTKEYEAGDLSRAQRKQLGYAIEKDVELLVGQSAEEQGLILIDADRVLILNFDQMIALGLDPTYDMRLSSLSDAQLAALGVPEECEVLKVNGKIVFRQYVAILENTFSEDSRSWTAIMESNTLPEVDPEGLDLAQLRKERAEAKAAKEAEEAEAAKADASPKTTTSVTEETTTAED